ncbi:MAG: tRNA 2-selenouridine(34) synthase MnmH [Spirochaetes bacterium]|nr:tRNA 2-selenouridine(34) synthase MnmH [Spirochaetota bacterium]
MADIIEPEVFLKKMHSVPAADVRTPAEFLNGHIPGAVNIPLFTNEERAEIGTIYKQRGNNAAVMRGLEITGPKLASFVKEAQSISPKNEILVHCWRGGMRSSSFAWLLETAGMKVSVLSGGYKNYRHFIRNEFLKMNKVIILGGMTGSGKTDILKSLAVSGEQVLDLEKYANHKGSAFGFIGQDAQPTNEQFENETYEQMQNMDLSERIWIEDESLKIGKVIINENLYSKMRNAPLIKMNIPQEIRVKRLVRDYCIVDADILTAVVNKITKRLGDRNARDVIDRITKSDFDSAVKIILDYYDKGYLHGIGKRDSSMIHEIDINSGDPDECAFTVLEFCKKLERIND